MEEFSKDTTGKYIPKPLQSIATLPKEEQNKLIGDWVSSGILPRSYSIDMADRIYKNKQLRDKYGADVYAAMTNKNSDTYISPEQRDEFYDRNEYLAGIESKYANDEKLPYYRSLTTEGLKDLWNSDIMSPEELKAGEEYLNSTRKGSEERQFTPKSKLLAALLAPTPESSTNVSIKDVADAVKYERGLLSDEEKKKYEEKVSQKTQDKENILKGTIDVGLPNEEVDKLVDNLYASNLKKFEDFKLREDNRFLNLPAVKSTTEQLESQWHQEVADGKTSYEDIRKAFQETFDNDIRGDGAGSRYYTGYKNRKELANFNIDDMIEKLAQYTIISDAYGDPATAMQMVDSGIFWDVRNNQNFRKRRGNTLMGVAAKANAMAANELFGGAVDLAHAFLDTPEEYKIFKTAENVLDSKGAGYLLNPNYWNYVDQYAVWNPQEIQRLNQNGGIGGRMNLYSPTGKMTGEQFIDEGFKMLGYMLPAVGISALTKRVPRTSGWARVISGAEVLGSAAALGSAYSSGVYNEITLGAEQALDNRFNAEAGDYINEYYASHPNFIANYLKDKGLSDNDSSILLIPAQQEAYKALYDAAKEQYFNDNPERKEAYAEAYDQILKDAQLGAKWDNLIETGRMVVSGSFWGKWSKSKLTRDLANRGVNPIRVAGGQAERVVSKNAARLKAVGQAVLAGGVDNGLDDVTAGIGKGLGLGDYNNYLGTVYGPENTIEGAKFTTNVLDGMLWGIDGATEAFRDPQTWIDTAIGAAGTVLGTRINGVTLIRDMVKKNGLFSAKTEGGKRTIDGEAATGLQILDRYVTNGAITSAADADIRYARTEDYIKHINEDIIPKYREDIATVGNFLREDISFNDMADSILEGKDIKQITMLKSAIRMMDAYKDPILSQIPEVQKFSELLNRGRKGKFSYAEIQSFINDPSNASIKNAVDEDGNSISEPKAVEAMQKNINNFLQISDKYNKLRDAIRGNSFFSVLKPEAKTQLAVQLTLKDLWEERLNSMQESLKTVGSEKAPINYDAEFGSLAGKERVIKSLENLISKDRKALASAKQQLKFWQEAEKHSETTEEKEKARDLVIDFGYIADYHSKAIEENQTLLQERNKAAVEFNEAGYTRTLSKEEIMRLSPRQRAKMLDPNNARDYSPEQRAIISDLTESLRNHINEDGSTQDLYQVAMDAGVMQDRLEASQTSINKVVANPRMLQRYMDRVKDRSDALLTQAVIADMKKEDMEKLATVTTPQEAVDVVFRGMHPANTLNKGFYLPASTVKEYIEKHPESTELFQDAQKMVQTLEDFYAASDMLFEANESRAIKESIAKATRQTNSSEEMISAIEGLMDSQSEATAKLQYDRVLEKMKTLGYQRDATKVRDRELERQKKQEAEVKKAEEEAKKDGKNYDWEGYKVGDTVYNKDSGNAATVVGFEGKDTMLLQVRFDDGTTGTYRYHAEKSKDALTKEKPEPNRKAPENAVPTVETPKNAPIEGVTELVSEESVPLDVEISDEGAVKSPSAEEQAEAAKSQVIEVQAEDPSDQGNSIPIDNGTISGNRYVTYSIDALKEGIVRDEIPEAENTLFGRLVEWLNKNNIKLQEIIDEEFGRILVDHPDIDIKFMMMKQEDSNNPLQKTIFNVIELTQALRDKYHDESRGGVIQANGKSWLIVGTVGFESGASRERRAAYDTMKAPISKRRMEYFNTNPTEQYYVDPVAYSRVQNTTSGRIVNQRQGAEAPTLKKVSELLKSAGMTLRQAAFGIQTKQVGKKSFATTSNVKDDSKVFGPRNLEDNRGRTFILIDTPNGNKIPGMIEPAMYNNIAEGTPLKDMINETIARLFSTSYETREKAIKELCGFLVLGDDKNILIGTKDVNVLTIKRAGMPDVSQKLGAGFDVAKFFKDVEDANFQINVSLNTLNNPLKLKIYDDSDALMTTVDSMRTAGMSYNIYMTDASGKPVILTPVGNAVPGTGKSEFKKYRSVRVSNTTYEYKKGQWVNRNNGNKVTSGTSLETSIIYNDAIQQGNLKPFATRDGKEYYNFIDNGVTFVVTRDSVGNIEFLNAEKSQAINNEIQSRINKQKRAQNLEDVNLEIAEEAVPAQPKKAEETLTPEQIAQQAVGNFETPAQPEVKAQPQKEVIAEVKETQSKQPKEVIADIGKKSLEDLQNTESLSTFEAVFNDDIYSDRLYDILDSKGWDITGVRDHDAQILKEHGVSITGITNVEDWLKLIEDCK